MPSNHYVTVNKVRSTKTLFCHTIPEDLKAEIRVSNQSGETWQDTLLRMATEYSNNKLIGGKNRV